MTQRICEAVYQVGGGALSDPRDCLVYLVDIGDLVLIDCGAGTSWTRIADNIRAVGFEPECLHTLVLTHCHVDHIGAVKEIVQASGCLVVAHELDAEAIRSGDSRRTAADWYGMHLEKVRVDSIVTGSSENLEFKAGTLTLIHTPGHTPGSMVAVVETPDNHRVLFGQDIHGPFDPAFDSDIDAWRQSMRDLLALDADILCEGHFGIFKGEESVRDFIEEHLAMHP